MKKEDVISLLNRLDQNLINNFFEAEDRKERHNVSYFNGYQACCDDIHSIIQDIISDLLIEDS